MATERSYLFYAEGKDNPVGGQTQRQAIEMGTKVLLKGLSYERRGRDNVVADSLALTAAYDFAAKRKDYAEANLALLYTHHPEYDILTSKIFSEGFLKKDPLAKDKRAFRRTHGKFDLEKFLELSEKVRKEVSGELGRRLNKVI